MNSLKTDGEKKGVWNSNRGKSSASMAPQRVLNIQRTAPAVAKVNARRDRIELFF